MKNGMMVALCLAFTLSGHGQMEKGRLTIEPHVGMTVANFVGSSSAGTTGQVGFMGGAGLQYGISKRLSFSAGINYAQYGARDDGKHSTVGYISISEKPYYAIIDEDNHLKYHVDYLTIPLTIAFHPYQGLYLRAGLQLGVKTKAKIKGETMMMGALSPFDLSSQAGFIPSVHIYGADIDNSIDDQVKVIDFAIPIGIGYEYKNVTLDARYLFGLLNVSKMKGIRLRNSAFMFTLGYKIPLHK